MHLWARDHDARILDSAQAAMPIGDGPITNSVTAFRSADMRLHRRVMPTDKQYRDATHLTTGTLGSAPEADKRDDGLRRG